MSETTKQSANDIIIRLIKCINEGSMGDFYKVANSYADNLASNSPIRFNIKRTINQKPLKLMDLQNLSSQMKSLLLTEENTDVHPFINTAIKAKIDELSEEWKYSETFKYHKFPIRNKILMHGATGNGKTTIAKYLSKVFNLPFVQVHSDQLVGSNIGETHSRIYQIFHQLNQPCVLFWDEIDSLAHKRSTMSSSAASMENDRMVNAILVNIEKMSDDVIFVAATNRFDALDSAFLRRMDISIEIPAPDTEEKQSFLKQLMDYYKLPDNFIFDDVENYHSYSQLKGIFLEKARKVILSEIKLNLNKGYEPERTDS